jgi:hypothetical protein
MWELIKWLVVGLIVGAVLGAWVTKHPDDARGYLESAGAKCKDCIRRVFKRSTPT